LAERETVYIVDDDENVRDSARALLEAYDLTVVDYDSAQAFLDGFETGGRGWSFCAAGRSASPSSSSPLRKMLKSRSAPGAPAPSLSSRSRSMTRSSRRLAGL
jgi:CheY-like chemotaxis protein